MKRRDLLTGLGLVAVPTLGLAQEEKVQSTTPIVNVARHRGALIRADEGIVAIYNRESYPPGYEKYGRIAKSEIIAEQNTGYWNLYKLEKLTARSTSWQCVGRASYAEALEWLQG